MSPRTISDLRILATDVEQRVEAVAADFATRLDRPAVGDALAVARRRAREHRRASLLVLVVGPAKSGKSTLVNLMASAYVSPTDFLECTVRPSIITCAADGEPSSLTVYRTVDPEHRAEQIDGIIDSLGSDDGDTATADAATATIHDLTKENIDRYVKLRLAAAAGDDTLVTSLRTPGGALLRPGVFVIDMPGFDGAYANIDNPTYEAIADRADLVVFVQSSNAAFSKVSDTFLATLALRNRDVPVCLVHNVFEAAHWRADADRRRVVDEHKRAAVDEIRRRGFFRK